MNIQDMYSKNSYKNNYSNKKKNNKIRTYVIISIFVILILLAAILPLFSKKNNKKEELKYSSSKPTRSEQIKNEYTNERIIFKDLKNFNSKLEYLISNPLINPNQVLNNKTADFMNEESFENGKIRVKRSFGRISYIVIMPSFNEELFNGIKITDDKNSIISKIGENETAINEFGLLSLENEKMYITIDTNNNMAVIIPKARKTDKLISNLEEFNKLTKKYLEDGNVKEYILKVTDVLKEYSTFEYTSNSIKLVYPNLGIEINTTGNLKNLEEGINIYNQGDINTTVINRLKDLEKNNKQILQVAIRNNSLIPKFSGEIINQTITIKDNGVKFFPDEKDTKQDLEKYEKILETSNKRNFDVSSNSNKTSSGEKLVNCVVFFKDNTEMYNLNDSQSADSIFCTDKYIYYSMENSGIYRLEPYTRKLIKIVDASIGLDIKYVYGNTIYLKNGKQVIDNK